MHHDMREAAFWYVVELKYPLFLAIVINCLRGLGDESLSTRFLVLRMLLDGCLVSVTQISPLNETEIISTAPADVSMQKPPRFTASSSVFRGPLGIRSFQSSN